MNNLRPEEAVQLTEWYDKEKVLHQGRYDVDQQLLDYCRKSVCTCVRIRLSRVACVVTFRDVDLLRQSCQKFKNIIADITKLNCFVVAPTISTFINKWFRAEFYEADTLENVPECGFSASKARSKMATAFLTYFAKQENLKLDYEKPFGKLSVDGFATLLKPLKTDYFSDKSTTGPVAFEIDGCHVHGLGLKKLTDIVVTFLQHKIKVAKSAFDREISCQW